jgi:hypothetical protein
MKLVIALLTVIPLGSYASAAPKSEIEAALSLSREHFRDTATVKDDYLDTVATITTVNGYKQKRGLFKIVWDDNFLRAHIDKKTGKTTFQLYQVIYYQSSSWRFYHTANFETTAGPQSTPLTLISRDVDCAGSSFGGCTYVEHVAFDVDEDLMRTISQMYSPGQRVGWKFKFIPKSGDDYNEAMLPAEVAGLVAKVDEYILNKGLGAEPGQ